MATMTLEEAREILGNKSNSLSDEELQDTITVLEGLAREIIHASIGGEFCMPLGTTERLADE